LSAPTVLFRGPRALILALGTAGSLALSGCGATPVAEAPSMATPTAGQDAAGCWEDDAKGVETETMEDGSEMEKKTYTAAPEMAIDPAKTYTATLKTNKGDITVEFLPGEAPNTVNNFVCLARDGFYDGTPFHRVVKGFMIQGGDPTGTGRGGPGYRFNDEKVVRPYSKGIMAMANAGPNTNGSQFFIMLEDYPLPPNYTIFGQVTAGQDVVDALGSTATTAGPGGERSVPTEPLIIDSVTITEA
jgi:cyclophilin family peptidyl-prolyl cis-trans isomerase